MTEIHFLDAHGPQGTRLFAIGDVHGRLDLLRKMHDLIAADLAANPAGDWRIIHLGDYVDRGPDSRGVLDYLIEQMKADARNIALAGNHDVGFCDFLDDIDYAYQFVAFGGLETARSYGVEIGLGTNEEMRAGQKRLSVAIPAAHPAFLRSLPYSAEFGDFFFCHAGIRPGIDLKAQTTEDLIWIRGDFLNYPGLHPKIIVHGHTPAPEVELLPNRANVDIKAWETGKLAALVIENDKKRLIFAEE